MVSSTPRPHLTPGKDPVPILQEAGWTPGPVWTGGKSHPKRDPIPDRPARSSVSIPTELPCPQYIHGLSRINNIVSGKDHQISSRINNSEMYLIDYRLQSQVEKKYILIGFSCSSSVPPDKRQYSNSTQLNSTQPNPTQLNSNQINSTQLNQPNPTQPNSTQPNQPSNQPTNQPTPWSRVLCEKLTVTQLVKKFSAFCGTWWFITMFTEQPTTCPYPEPD